MTIPFDSRLAIAAAFAATAILPQVASAYPLDGYEYTKIPRLQAQRMIQ